MSVKSPVICSTPKNTLAKDKRVNIRISSKDLEEIQAIAVEDGLPYQTLMSSVLHRYISGRFVENGTQPVAAYAVNRAADAQR